MRSSLAPLILLLATLLGVASAQDCLPEHEPNDTPAEATALGALSCGVGTLASGDQDVFVWTVTDEDAELMWTLGVESIPGQLTVANLFRVTFADNGVDVTAADELLALRTRDGSFNETAPFMVAPGSYVLGTSASGGQGEYVLRLAPGELLRRGRSNGGSRDEIEGAFALFGALEGERTWTWTVDPDDAGKRWQLELTAPLGGDLDLELIGPGGGRVVSGSSAGEPLRLSSLGLDPGAYTLTLRGGDGGPYQLSAVSVGLLTDGGEVEPNDRWEDANVVTFERPVTGAGTDVDYFVFDVGPDLAGRPFDLTVESDDNVTVALFDSDRNELQGRRGSFGALRSLVLPEGSYGLEVRASGERYQLAIEPGGALRDGFEVEPNDELRGATPLGEELTIRGELGPQDSDTYRFTTEGEAQLWRLQVLGQGRIEITTFNGGGIRQQSLSGDRRVRLDNVVLLAGEHVVQIEGDEGEYAFRALALGPAPEPPPPDPVVESAPLETAPAPPPQDEAEVEAVPVGPPPPPGLVEREPNDDDSRAELLEVGVTRVGVLTGSRDVDTYRFFLAHDQFVRIEAVPAADGGIFFDVAGARVLERGAGVPAVMERKLLAGDYFLRLRSSEPSLGFYQLRLSLLDPLARPDDAEPNDELAQASALPADLILDGEVGAVGRADHYALPTFAVETELRIEGVAEEIGLDILGDERPTLERGDGVVTALLPAGVPTVLRLRGEGRYRLTLAFGAPVDPSALALPNGAAGAEIAFAESRAEVTAYWFRGQRYSGEVTITNTSSERRTYTLEGASSHATVVPRLPPTVALAAGESAEVPVLVPMPHDLRDDQPIRITVGARDAEGIVTAALTLQPTCDAPPVDSALTWALPDPLLGGLNVAWDGFGSAVVGDERNRDPLMFDSLTSPATGGYAETDDLVTVDLPGDAPILLAGTLLHPQAGSNVDRQLAEFELLVSVDGITFTPVLSGELQAARIEQAFVFDAPVPARFARLRFGPGHDGRSGGWLGEWKLIAAEGASLGRINLADPGLGGHVVWSDPLVQSNNSDHAILNEEPNGLTIDARFIDEITWVVGFHHNRAAQIEEIEWIEQRRSLENDRFDGDLFERVTVEASLASPVGPWRELAAWELQRDSDGRATLTFDAPEWARYLRFTAPKPEGGDTFLPPQTLRVFERPEGDGYRSALGEWGHYRRDAVFELLNEGGAVAQPESDDNDRRETAQPIASGEAVEGSVQIVEDLDWFRLAIPDGENLLEIALAGDPTINYLYQLFDAAGEPLGFDLEEEGDGVILRYFGEPGDYFLRLEEPKRSVIFSWDTSGSVGPYEPITYNSLARFARDLDPEREFVQLLAFDDPEPTWLLPYWSADPLRVQERINTYDRRADSSNAENGLLTASRALEERVGTRAVLFMTDAESGGYQLTPELWRSLERSRARVFTFEISTGGSYYSQDLMQAWANVNAGHYDYARNVADFDVGFARAACILRRPKRYRVEVTTAFREPPGPGALRILRGEGGAPPAVEVIFDASGSMGRLLPSGVSRIETAKGVLTDFVANVLPDGAGFALRAYGHIAPSSCETRLDVPLGPLDRAEALAAIDAIEPKLLSQTPIADALLAVASDLSDATGPTTVVLLTDGLESCDGDPRAAVEQLRADGVALQLAIISLGLEDPADVAVFEALAEAVGASYVDAQDLGTLEASISAALRPAFEVLDAAGSVVATGTVEGDPVSLPGGVYTVRVLSSPVAILGDVRIPAETTVELPLDSP